MEYLFDNKACNQPARRFVSRQNLKNISDAYYKGRAAQGIGGKQRADTGAAESMAGTGRIN